MFVGSYHAYFHCGRVQMTWTRAARLGSFQASALTVEEKTPSPQGGGGRHIVWLLHGCEGFNGFWTWEVWRHEHLHDPLPRSLPPPRKSLGYLSPCLRLRHSASGREEKSCAAEKGKYPRDVSWAVSPGSGVKGRSWAGMSGVKWSRQASVGLVKCLPGRPADLWPGGNTKQWVLVQVYPNRMEIRGGIPDMVQGAVRNQWP